MKTINFLFSFLILAFSINAQILDPVKWDISKEKIGEGEYKLVFTANIDEGWNVYSQFTSDDGPVPTTITYENMEGVELVGESKESGNKKEGPDPLFDNVVVIKYLADEPFTIEQIVKTSDPTAALTGYLTFMTCDDEKCLPPKDIDFEFDFGEGDSASGSESTIDVANALSAQNDTQEGSKILDPVKWSFDIKKESDDTFTLTYTADIEETWTVYSQNTSEDGPVPTTITYENMEGVELIGEGVESGAKKEGPDPLFDNVMVVKYLADEPFVIKQKVKVNDTSKPFSGYLTFMTCDDRRCLTPKDIDFAFDFTGDGKYLAPVMADIGNMKITDGVLDQKIDGLASTYKEPIGDCGDDDEEKTGYLWTFLLGFFGGLFALLTPCVFPMIPITVSFFTKDTKRKGWVNGVIYGLSIIIIYVTLGLLITAIMGPEALNRLSTNWIANTIFFLIFMAFAFSFFGYYEITLPSSWSTKSDSMADKGGLIGIFFMAFTLAIVSFSCTGPIIGSALVSAANKGEFLGPLLVMFGFSLALALPFGLFAAFPAWLNSLPRSGSWMNSVKVVLGFLEVALAFKFLSVADLTNHWNFLKYELFMAIWILVFLGMAIYLFGYIKFPHDSPIKKLSMPRKIFATSVLAFSIYLATGFMINKDTGTYNALGAMSGLAPPANYNFFLPSADVDPDIKSRYPSYTKCANNINCFKDYYEGISYANEVGKPVFIDFTGHGCVNCRKTEDLIWVDERIRAKLNDEVVLISLYVDDDKKLEDVYISAASGGKIRNVGNKWADFQIVNFEQNSQPLYIMVTPDEKVITKPRGFQEGVDSYYDYLDCGLQHFNEI